MSWNNQPTEQLIINSSESHYISDSTNCADKTCLITIRHNFFSVNYCYYTWVSIFYYYGIEF